MEEGEKRILVVDDDPYYLDIIPEALSREGDYEISVASTGFDAGALVVEHNPHVIILDIHLSDVDGRQVCERVKARPETSATRILAISGFLDEDEERDLANYGFDGYLKKPFSLSTLNEEVRKLLERRTSKRPHPKRGRTEHPT